MNPDVNVCFDTPYDIWSDIASGPPYKHHPSKAKKFYEYLLDLKERTDGKK
jgi:hypothetical protein